MGPSRGVPQEHLAGELELVPVDVFSLVELKLRLDVIPFDDLFAKYDSDAAITQDFTTVAAIPAAVANVAAVLVDNGFFSEAAVRAVEQPPAGPPPGRSGMPPWRRPGITAA